MEDNRLQKGIAILYDMEKNNYLMTRAISQLNHRINKLGLRKTFRVPSKKHVGFEFADLLGLLWIPGIIVGAIVGFFIALDQLRGLFVNILVGGALGLIGSILLSFIIGYAVYLRENGEAERQYNEYCQEYNNLIKSDKLRVIDELYQKEYLIEQRDMLISQKSKSESLLNSFYEVIGIDTAYRNIVPIGYMYEYSRLGISRKLEGADGLYYLIRQELRAEQLIYTLQEISEKLDTIIDQQREIYRELHSINEKCDRMIKLAEKAVKIGEYQVEQSEIAAYNLERIRKEEEFQSFMQAYTFYTIHKND